MSKLSLGLATALFMTALSFSGCCGPIGPGCVDTGCNDCSGFGANQYIAQGPLDAIRNARRRMTCGVGCGETYVGEWISTPPDCSDPCCGDQFVGGAVKARPFCWQPGTLLRGMYGQRFCSGDASSAQCGCGDSICDGGCGMTSTAQVMHPATSGCSTCNQSVQGTTQIVATAKPAMDQATSIKQKPARMANVKNSGKRIVR